MKTGNGQSKYCINSSNSRCEVSFASLFDKHILLLNYFRLIKIVWSNVGKCIGRKRLSTAILALFFSVLNDFNAYAIHVLFFYKNNVIRTRWGSDWPKIKNNLRISSGWGWEKVKVLLVETVLHLVIYVRNVHNKNTEAPFPIIIISTIYCSKWYTYIQTISIVFQYLVFLFWFLIISNCSEK